MLAESAGIDAESVECGELLLDEVSCFSFGCGSPIDTDSWVSFAWFALLVLACGGGEAVTLLPGEDVVVFSCISFFFGKKKFF